MRGIINFKQMTSKLKKKTPFSHSSTKLTDKSEVHAQQLCKEVSVRGLGMRRAEQPAENFFVKFDEKCRKVRDREVEGGFQLR